MNPAILRYILFIAVFGIVVSTVSAALFLQNDNQQTGPARFAEATSKPVLPSTNWKTLKEHPLVLCPQCLANDTSVTKKNNCDGCLQACKQGDFACIKKCQIQFPNGTCDCALCKDRCLGKSTCIQGCRTGVNSMGWGTTCGVVPDKTTCGGCLEKCKSGDDYCVEMCETQFPKGCDCDTCQSICGSNKACTKYCRDSDGLLCSSGGDECNSCIDTCVSDNFQDWGTIFDCMSNTCNIHDTVDTGRNIPSLWWMRLDDICENCEAESIESWLQCLKDNRCSCPKTPVSYTCESCLQKCRLGDTPCIQKCNQLYPTTCNCASCLEKCGQNTDCTLECQNSGQTCNQGGAWASCVDGKCLPGQTAVLVDGVCLCKTPLSTPMQAITALPTFNSKQTPACLDCYRNCSMPVTKSKSQNLLVLKTTGNANSTACQKQCDNRYKTNLTSCACSDMKCSPGETTTLKSDFSCQCLKTKITGSGMTDTAFPDLSSQWTEHREGTPTDIGPTCTQRCVAWSNDPWRCVKYEQVCS